MCLLLVMTSIRKKKILYFFILSSTSCSKIPKMGICLGCCEKKKEDETRTRLLPYTPTTRRDEYISCTEATSVSESKILGESIYFSPRANGGASKTTSESNPSAPAKLLIYIERKKLALNNFIFRSSKAR